MIALRVAPLNLGGAWGGGTQLRRVPRGRIVSGDFRGNKLPGYFHPVPPGQKHASLFASHVSQPYLRKSVFICGCFFVSSGSCRASAGRRRKVWRGRDGEGGVRL